jgi:NitT/TauT family transport system permease protein
MAIWDQKSKTEPEKGAGRRRVRYPLWTVPLSILSAYLLWEAASRWSGLPAFILPDPGAVARRLLVALRDGTLLRHTAATLSELLGGLFLGFTVATALGYVLAKSKTIERILSPYIVASQSIPVVAIAPLLVIWFGPGRISKVMISGLIVFFPILINTIVGVRSVPQDLYDLMRSLRATRWQIFTKLEIPAALPVLLGGLKIGATLSVIGAVVGELVGADQGLGLLINIGRGVYDTTLVYVAVITLVILALALFTFVAALEWWFLRWREPPANH